MKQLENGVSDVLSDEAYEQVFGLRPDQVPELYAYLAQYNLTRFAREHGIGDLLPA